jgi:hypothetical protein
MHDRTYLVGICEYVTRAKNISKFCRLHGYMTFVLLVFPGNISPYITSYLRFRSSSSNLRYSDSMWIMSCIQVSMHIALMCGGVIELKLGARITSSLGGLFVR